MKSNNGHCIDGKELARRNVEFAGYRITRLRPVNRFQSMGEMLLLVRGFWSSRGSSSTRPGAPKAHAHSSCSRTRTWVASDGEMAIEVVCPASTLDELLADRVSAEDRVLLKLDLEGHEVHALIGASYLLKAVEVVLTEVQFYDINNSGRPTFSDVLEFFRQRGFEIYDIACLSQRPMRLRMGDVVFVRQRANGRLILGVTST